MEDWKIRRQLYYSHKTDFSDDWKHFENRIVVRNYKVADDALLYLTKQQDQLYYPGKTYAIAVAYACWLKKEFGGLLINYLKDPDLLFDDPYFIPYKSDPKTYDLILTHLDFSKLLNVDQKLKDLQLTRRYFHQEFLLDENGKKLLP